MVLIRLGEYIELAEKRNDNNIYGENDVVGISTDKRLIETKADLSNVNFKSYKLLPPNTFAYVADTSRRGDKVSLAFNQKKDTYLVSSISTVFRVKDEKNLLSHFLFMYFNRPEFDRFSRFHSWGSARETFSWEEMCDVVLELPSVEIQQKYVDVYNSMVLNQQAYEKGLDDLKLTCDAYVEKLRTSDEFVRIGEYIKKSTVRNDGNRCNNIMGLSTIKQFRTQQKKTKDEDYSKFKIVKPRHIAYVQVTDTWKVLAFALNDSLKDIAVSPIYEVFSVNSDILLPEFLAIWMKRLDFDRYARFHSWGSARETFSWEEMCNVKIPIPNIKIQQAIVDIYITYQLRQEINKQLKIQIKELCAILIKGALEEGAKC